MTVNDLRALVNDDFDAVNQVIIENIQSQVGLIDDLSTHIVKSGGKRLRPLLVLLASRACGYQGNNHVPLAAMVEFFHTATLLHDDVVDESTLRRGQETANEIWGSKASILVGDYLFTQSVELMVGVGNWDVVKLMSNTSHQISCGEVKQLVNKNNPYVTIEQYLDVIQSKTALLFAASAAIGALLAERGTEVEKAMYAYGLHLGNAFQLIDDALDYCSDAQTIGKNIGDDLADGKATMPLLCILKHGTQAQKQLVEQSLKEGSLVHLEAILTAIEETNAIEYTQRFAAQEVDTAITQLHALPASPYKEALEKLARFAISRQN